jgi:hypothetical protein
LVSFIGVGVFIGAGVTGAGVGVVTGAVGTAGVGVGAVVQGNITQILVHSVF